MTNEITLATTGMHCRSCSMLVDMTVSELEGVTAVATALETGLTQVEFDADVVSLDEILAAIRGIGYDAEPLD